MRLKHWVVFILLNIIISAVTALALLTYWERAHPSRVSATPAAALAATPARPGGGAAATSPAPAQVASPAPPRPVYTPTPFQHTVYTVQSGDTLSAISRRFDIPLEDLLVANDLSIDAMLQVGQPVKIPTGAGGQPAAARTAQPTPTPSPPSSELVPVAQVSVEVRQVIARGDPSREAVVIANLGQPVNLLGWKLSDNEGTEYTFPDLTLWPGGTITVHTGSGPDSVSDLYWKRIAPVWAEPGDVVTLLDANGSPAARYQLP